MIRKLFKPKVLPFYIHVIITDNTDKLQKFLLKYYDYSLEHSEWDKFNAFVVLIDYTLIAVFRKKEITIPIIAHECLHCVQKTYHKLEEKTYKVNSEIMTYLITWYVKKIVKVCKDNHVRIK